MGFRSKGGPSTGPGESTSWRQWSRQADESRFDEDLGSVESDVEGFGDSGATAFSAAWSEAPEAEGELPEPVSDRRSQRLRNIDRRFSPVRIFGAALIVAGVVAAVWFALNRGETVPIADGQLDDVLLIAPGRPRVYAEGSSFLALDDSWDLDDAFIDADGNNPIPTTFDEVSVPEGVRAGAILWGGRTHIAVVGPGVGAEDMCVVGSLFAEDFEVIDVAADGDCADRYAPTGDRMACRGEDVVLLEVWPEDPGVAAEQPLATRVRVRVERSVGGGGFESIRVSDSLSRPFGVGVDELAGGPETDAEFVVDDQSGQCLLRDRSGVAVQLL